MIVSFVFFPVLRVYFEQRFAIVDESNWLSNVLRVLRPMHSERKISLNNEQTSYKPESYFTVAKSIANTRIIFIRNDDTCRWFRRVIYFTRI